MSNYEITVVTPYHNEEMEIFHHALDSLKNQTLGFEKIEWVVAIHNSRPEMIEQVQNLLGEYPNVKTIVVNNDIHSASSPRNEGLKIATAKYVGFLDSDDSYTPWALKKAVYHMKKSGAQGGWFRREFELQSKDNIPIREIVLWDQTQEEIIIEKGVNWDDEKLLSGLWGHVTSRIFDREFLLENDIWFDNNITYGEDFLFITEMFGHGKKFCYLPQTVGYHQFINSKSLIQTAHHDAPMMMNISEGVAKILNTMNKYGLYLDAATAELLMFEVMYMKGCPELTLENRYAIRDMFLPILEAQKPTRVNKLYSEKTIQDRWALRDYILNPEKYMDSQDSEPMLLSNGYQDEEVRSDLKLLMDILDENHDTDFGNRFGFVNIHTISGYMSRVPISEYSFYEPLVRLQTGIGEAGIIVNEPIVNYVYSIGNMNNRKLIPATNSHLDTYEKYFEDMVNDEDTLLLYESLRSEVSFNDATTANSIYGAIVQSYFKKRIGSTVESTADFAVPTSLIFNKELVATKLVRLLYALTDVNLTQIVAPNTWNVCRVLELITQDPEGICNAVENGVKSFAEFIPNPKRAMELRTIFAGMPKGTLDLKKIWPKFKQIVAYKDDEFRVYTDRLEKLLGDVKIVNSPIFIPEAMLGVPTMNSDLFELDLDSAFYEFVKLGENNEAEGDFVLYDSLEIGSTYKVYVTNKAGLYRYDTKQYISVKEIVDGMPHFVIDSSVSQCVTVSNKKVSSVQIYGALKNACKKAGITVADYAFWMTKDRLNVFAETDSECVAGNSKAVEENLQKELGVEVIVKFLEPETMLLFAETKASKLKVTTDTIYPTHCVELPPDKNFIKISVAE